MAPRRRCPTCGSRQWHKEPSSGLIACSEGHILQNYRNEAKEADELGPHAVKKRTLKSGRQIKGRESKSNPQLYHGERSRFLYFQSLQLLLRHQIHVLTQLWALPAEFESICRDIWALHTSCLSNPLPAEPLEHMLQERDQQTVDLLKTQNSSSRPLSPHTPKDSETGSGSDEEDTDSEMASLLRRNSETESSSSEDESKVVSDFPQGRKKRTQEYEKPISTLATLVVACWTLRIPIIYQDLLREVAAYHVPYLNGLQVLPSAVVSHLSKQTSQALSPHFAPSALQLHHHASRLTKVINKTFDVATPELNAAPILWRCVRSLNGTPILYHLAKRLAQILSLPLVLHHSLSPRLSRKKARDTEGHRDDGMPPELLLLSAVIIAIKLVYGIDGETRNPRRNDDPACALPQIGEFIKMLEGRDAGSDSGIDQSLRSNWSVGDLNEAEADKYLDFCEKALLGSTEKATDRIVSKHFPVSKKAESLGEPVVKNFGRSVTNCGMTAAKSQEGSTCEPGSNYGIYNARDVLGTLPRRYRMVIERGELWLGMEASWINETVERHERRLVAWWQQEKQRTCPENKIK
ncbi:hypothetical protein BDN72DRAFT_954379 [Pluteus cervinus]|uniref:Uncharacterized protein n=1 Tax=Pluteus cervinus TaxID=181527 RepID=A0ACD3BDU7_9AGAR|nr:hypothetical protein BDN72DRAFT_954379 [Pluteus cervinus]